MDDGFLEYWTKQKSMSKGKNETYTKMDEKMEDERIPRYREPRRAGVRNEYDQDETLSEQVDSIKERLYRKIDVCFMKYGLNGLRKIDESIAAGLSDYIEPGISRKPVQKVTKSMSSRVPDDEPELDMEEPEDEMSDEDRFIEEAAAVDEAANRLTGTDRVKKITVNEQNETEEPEDAGTDEELTQQEDKPDEQFMDLEDIGNILDKAN